MTLTLTGSAVVIAWAVICLMALCFIAVLALAVLRLYDTLWNKLVSNTKFHREIVDFVRHKYTEKRKPMK